LTICLSAKAQYQENAPYFKGYNNQYCLYHWTTNNGLPQSHISGISQTKNKLLWISTYNGIVSFDGKKFINEFQTLKTHKLNSFITSVACAGDSVIWASTKEVVVYYRHRIVRKIAFNEKNIFIPSIQVFDNKIYFFSDQCTFELKGKKLTKIFNFKENKSLKDHIYLTAVFDNQKIVYLTKKGNNRYLIEFDPKSGKNTVTKQKHTISNIAMKNGEMLFLIKGTWYKSNKQLTKKNSVVKTLLMKNEVFLQSSVTPKLSFFYTGRSIQINQGKHEEVVDVADYMQDNELFSSYVDHTGNLWLGTNSNGLFMFRRYPFVFPTFSNNIRVSNSSHSFLDSQNTVWFDSECTMTYGVDINTNKIVHSIPNTCNWTNLEWNKDSLVFLAYGTGHCWYDKKNRKTTPISSISFPVNYCYKYKSRTAILGGEGALYLWNGKKTSIFFKFRNKATICNEIVRYKNIYYFATTEGLYRFSNMKWKCLIDSKKTGFEDLRSICPISETDQLVVGTSGNGILRYDLKTKKIHFIKNIPHQLRDCWSMIRDHYNQIWITSNNGIVQVELDELQRSLDHQQNYMQLNHYRYETGVENVEFNSRTANKGYLLKNGEIIFSGLTGPIIIEPRNNFTFNNVLADIFIEEATINGKQIPDPNRKLSFSEEDHLEVEFTLPTFSMERVLQFEYRIKGYTNGWTLLNGRQLIFDNFPAGKYNLEIRLLSGKRSLTVPIQVKQKHPWLWPLYLLLLLFTVILVVYITVRTTKHFQHRKNLADHLKQKLKLMEIEALQAQMNPHFTFNCLNTIQFLFMSGNTESANKYLSDFSSLMRLTLELMRASISSLDVELKITLLYINLEQLQFDDGFEFRLINNLQTPQTEIKAPTMFLQLFVENAILHGLKNVTDKKPVLTLEMDETENEYIFKVSDNGQGFIHKGIGNHKSVGLDILRERFYLKSQVYNWDINFKISQLEEITNDIKTTVTITFGKSFTQPF
jgi:hypothetical protein